MHSGRLIKATCKTRMLRFTR